MPDSNDFEVYYVLNHDPHELVRMGEFRARSGHDAIQKAIKVENESVSPLAACDLLAFPKWAAHRCHYNGHREAAT